MHHLDISDDPFSGLLKKLGQARYDELAENRLQKTTATLSIWDTLRQIKLKRFCNWMKKRSFTVGNKTIKLREDRAFYRKCLIITQNRPELLVKMPELIGNYEMSIIPRSVFSPDGSPLLCVDKASLMTRIIAHQPVQGQLSVAGDREKVLIIDAMVEAKALRDSACFKLTSLVSFISRIKNKAAGGYQEIKSSLRSVGER